MKDLTENLLPTNRDALVLALRRNYLSGIGADDVALPSACLLDLSFNAIQDIKALWVKFPKCWWLNASQNQICSLSQMCLPAALGLLDITENSIRYEELSSLAEVQVLCLNVSHEKNPHHDIFSAEYRGRVLEKVPHVWVLDNDFIAMEERTKLQIDYHSKGSDGMLSSHFTLKELPERQSIFLRALHDMPVNQAYHNTYRLQILLEDYLDYARMFNKYSYSDVSRNRPIPSIDMMALLAMPHQLRLDFAVLLTASIFFTVPPKIMTEALIVLVGEHYTVVEIAAIVTLPMYVRSALVHFIKKITQREMMELTTIQTLSIKPTQAQFEYSNLLSEHAGVEEPPLSTFVGESGYLHIRPVIHFLRRPVDHTLECLEARDVQNMGLDFSELENEIMSCLPDVPTRSTRPPLNFSSPEFQTQCKWLVFLSQRAILLLKKAPSCPLLTKAQNSAVTQNYYNDLEPLLGCAGLTLSDMELADMNDGRMRTQKKPLGYGVGIPNAGLGSLRWNRPDYQPKTPQSPPMSASSPAGTAGTAGSSSKQKRVFEFASPKSQSNAHFGSFSHVHVPETISPMTPTTPMTPLSPRGGSNSLKNISRKILSMGASFKKISSKNMSQVSFGSIDEVNSVHHIADEDRELSFKEKMAIFEHQELLASMKRMQKLAKLSEKLEGTREEVVMSSSGYKPINIEKEMALMQSGKTVGSLSVASSGSEASLDLTFIAESSKLLKTAPQRNRHSVGEVGDAGTGPPPRLSYVEISPRTSPRRVEISPRHEEISPRLCSTESSLSHDQERSATGLGLGDQPGFYDHTQTDSMTTAHLPSQADEGIKSPRTTTERVLSSSHDYALTRPVNTSPKSAKSRLRMVEFVPRDPLTGEVIMGTGEETTSLANLTNRSASKSPEKSLGKSAASHGLQRAGSDAEDPLDSLSRRLSNNIAPQNLPYTSKPVLFVNPEASPLSLQEAALQSAPNSNELKLHKVEGFTGDGTWKTSFMLAPPGQIEDFNEHMELLGQPYTDDKWETLDNPPVYIHPKSNSTMVITNPNINTMLSCVSPVKHLNPIVDKSASMKLHTIKLGQAAIFQEARGALIGSRQYSRQAAHMSEPGQIAKDGAVAGVNVDAVRDLFAEMGTLRNMRAMSAYSVQDTIKKVEARIAEKQDAMFYAGMNSPTPAPATAGTSRPSSRVGELGLSQFTDPRIDTIENILPSDYASRNTSRGVSREGGSRQNSANQAAKSETLSPQVSPRISLVGTRVVTSPRPEQKVGATKTKEVASPRRDPVKRDSTVGDLEPIVEGTESPMIMSRMQSVTQLAEEGARSSMEDGRNRQNPDQHDMVSKLVNQGQLKSEFLQKAEERSPFPNQSRAISQSSITDSVDLDAEGDDADIAAGNDPHIANTQITKTYEIDVREQIVDGTEALVHRVQNVIMSTLTPQSPSKRNSPSPPAKTRKSSPLRKDSLYRGSPQLLQAMYEEEKELLQAQAAEQAEVTQREGAVQGSRVDNRGQTVEDHELKPTMLMPEEVFRTQDMRTEALKTRNAVMGTEILRVRTQYPKIYKFSDGIEEARQSTSGPLIEHHKYTTFGKVLYTLPPDAVELASLPRTAEKSLRVQIPGENVNNSSSSHRRSKREPAKQSIKKMRGVEGIFDKSNPILIERIKESHRDNPDVSPMAGLALLGCVVGKTKEEHKREDANWLLRQHMQRQGCSPTSRPQTGQQRPSDMSTSTTSFANVMRGTIGSQMLLERMSPRSEEAFRDSHDDISHDGDADVRDDSPPQGVKLELTADDMPNGLETNRVAGGEKEERPPTSPSKTHLVPHTTDAPGTASPRKDRNDSFHEQMARHSGVLSPRIAQILVEDVQVAQHELSARLSARSGSAASGRSSDRDPKSARGYGRGGLRPSFQTNSTASIGKLHEHGSVDARLTGLLHEALPSESIFAQDSRSMESPSKASSHSSPLKSEGSPSRDIALKLLAQSSLAGSSAFSNSIGEDTIGSPGGAGAYMNEHRKKQEVLARIYPDLTDDLTTPAVTTMRSLLTPHDLFDDSHENSGDGSPADLHEDDGTYAPLTEFRVFNPNLPAQLYPVNRLSKQANVPKPTAHQNLLNMLHYDVDSLHTGDMLEQSVAEGHMSSPSKGKPLLTCKPILPPKTSGATPSTAAVSQFGRKEKRSSSSCTRRNQQTAPPPSSTAGDSPRQYPHPRVPTAQRSAASDALKMKPLRAADNKTGNASHTLPLKKALNCVPAKLSLIQQQRIAKLCSSQNASCVDKETDAQRHNNQNIMMPGLPGTSLTTTTPTLPTLPPSRRTKSRQIVESTLSRSLSHASSFEKPRRRDIAESDFQLQNAYSRVLDTGSHQRSLHGDHAMRRSTGSLPEHLSKARSTSTAARKVIAKYDAGGMSYSEQRHDFAQGAFLLGANAYSNNRNKMTQNKSGPGEKKHIASPDDVANKIVENYLISQLNTS